MKLSSGLRVYTVLAMIAVCVLGWAWYRAQETAVAGKLSDLEAEYGIDIELDELEFPARWRGRIAYRHVIWLNRASAIEALALDLARYPPELVRAHLDTVYIYRTLRIDGHGYGGTYNRRRAAIYIAASWLGDRGDWPEAMGFHHELSSLLLRQVPGSLIEAWRQANAPGFEYRFRDTATLALPADELALTGSPQTYEAGFLCNYGRLSLEEDLNTFFQYVMAKPQRLARLERRYHRVAAKAALARRMLGALGWRRAGAARRHRGLSS